jgi:hypothetical protein
MKSISIVDVRVFPCRAINLTLAVLQHFHGISRGLTVPGIIVLGKAPDNVAKFVKQNGDSSLRRVSIIKTYLQPVPSRTHASGWIGYPRLSKKEWSVGIQRNDGVASRAFGWPGAPRMFEGCDSEFASHSFNVSGSLPIQFVAQGTENFWRSAIGFLKPSRTRAPGLQYFQCLPASSRDPVTGFAHSVDTLSSLQAAFGRVALL